SVEGADFHVTKCTWKVQPEDIEDSRGEVSDVVELPTRGSSIQDRSRVMDNQGDPDSTAVGELLVHPQRCISSLCPPGWVVVMGEGATQLVNAGKAVLEAVFQAEEVSVFVGRSVRSPFPTRAIVGHDQDKSVVCESFPFEEFEQAADLLIGIRHASCEHCLHW